MRKKINLLMLFVVTSSAFAQTPAPDGDDLLRAMSAKLAAAKSLQFEARREIDPVLLEGRDRVEKETVVATVLRPNKLAARVTTKDGTRRFVADGGTLWVHDKKKKHYAAVPMRTSLDGLVEKLDAEYGFTPPLAEFALSDPYADFRRQAHTVTYLGRAKTSGGFLGLGGVECYRVGLKGKVADAELWIAVSDQLPRELVATFHGGGRPQVRVAFTSWELNAPVSEGEFVFGPPKGATKIEMWSIDRMAAHRTKVVAKNN